jgi:hypothetical protein
MNRMAISFALSLILLQQGCCKHRAVELVLAGHSDLAACRQQLEHYGQDAPPVPITCPGDEVTVCFGASEVNNVQINIAPDPQGKSGQFPRFGLLYLNVSTDTSVKVATDCDSVTRQVTVINKPTPATFDATWDRACQKMSYSVDPLFVSDTVQTTDVLAKWSVGCQMPPFLLGFHQPPIFSFSIDAPNKKSMFSSPQPADGDWQYALKAKCNSDFTCDPNAKLPFEMTLICPPPPPVPPPG